MKTLIQHARMGDITEEIKRIAQQESISIENVIKGLSEGWLVITQNRLSRGKKMPLAVGRGTRTKVNANIGTSKGCSKLAVELVKLDTAIKAGADAVMDLSTGGNLPEIRKKIAHKCTVSMGTVPVYQLIVEGGGNECDVRSIDKERFFKVVEEHAGDGVDFVTIHCGITHRALERLAQQGRTMNIVSRGGAFMARWMYEGGKENPYYEDFDRLLDIARKYDITLSLGDALRPGSIVDATDRAQVEELTTLGELVNRANSACVSVIVEGPGHVPLRQIKTNIELEKSLCNDAPFYVLGPLVTDIAPGYDHITAAIGGAIAGAAGADFLCYVTPSEHLRLPTIEDVHEGVIASRIAAHAADIAKGLPGALERDRKMSEARKKLDWQTQAELSIDSEKIYEVMRDFSLHEGNVCSMCGEFCAIKMTDKICKGKAKVTGKA